MTVLATLLSFTAFLLLGLATDRHHESRFGGRLSAEDVRRRRMTAWALLLAALAAAIVDRGWAFGPVLWSGLAMAGAAASFLWLNLRPPSRRAKRRTFHQRRGPRSWRIDA